MLSLQRSDQDREWMEAALAEARSAALAGEVPVGSVIVLNGAEIARARNEKKTDPTAHAEIQALREASRKLDTWNLSGCDLYVTLEPCPMCAGAIVQARIRRVVFGAWDPKAGACGTLYDILRDTRLNHRCLVRAGVMSDACSDLLRAFFRRRRGFN
jgi:tRNA(adenine34) deaminase